MSSIIPLEACFSAKDESLFEANISFPTLRYESVLKKFPGSLKEHIRKCKKDPSFLRVLPDSLFNQSEFRRLKENLGTETVNEDVQNALKNVSDIDFNASELSDLDLQDIMNFDIHSYFRNIEDFFTELNPKNASSVLKTIKNHPRSSVTLSKAAQTALKSYKALTIELSNSMNKENSFNSTLKTLNNTATMTVIQIDNFKLDSEVLVYFFKENISDVYMSLLNETVIVAINSVSSNLDSSIYYFRKSISPCSILITRYKSFVVITCELILKPLTASWMGSLFVDIFLFLSVILCLYAVPLFLIPPRQNSLNAEPSSSSDKMDPDITVSENRSNSTSSRETPETNDANPSDVIKKEKDFLKKANGKSVGTKKLKNRSLTTKKVKSEDESTLLSKDEKSKNVEKNSPTHKARVDDNSSFQNSANIQTKELEFTDSKKKFKELEEREISEIEESKSLSEILRIHSVKARSTQNLNRSFSTSSVINSAEVKTPKSLREILTLHSKADKNKKVASNSALFNDSSNAVSLDDTKSVAKGNQEKTVTSVDKENSDDVKEEKSLREILIEEQLNINNIPDFESSVYDSSYTELKSLREILSTHSNETKDSQN